MSGHSKDGAGDGNGISRDISYPPSMDPSASPGAWGPNIIVVNCRSGGETSPLVTGVIKRPKTGGIAEVLRLAWKLFKLDGSEDIYGRKCAMKDDQVLGRVLIGLKPQSCWVYMAPEVWDELPLNMEFLIEGPYTQLEHVF